MSVFVTFNGELLTPQELRVSPDNRGIMYGDGCFETFRSYKGKFLHLEKHFGRLTSGLSFLGIETEFGLQEFQHSIEELIEANEAQNEDALIRVQTWRKGGRGYSTEIKEANWLTVLMPISETDAPISIATVNTRAIPNKALPRQYKFSNGLNYIWASKEASEAGADDALMLTIDETVSECTVANVFWVKGDTVFTPSESCDLLPGITRGILMDLISESSNLNMESGTFSLEDISSAEAIFCTNSVRGIRRVSQLDGKAFDTEHPVTDQLSELFELYKHQHLK